MTLQEDRQEPESEQCFGPLLLEIDYQLYRGASTYPEKEDKL